MTIGERPTRKSFNRKIREAVYAKCGGHCAYCGCEISIKEMQIDHLKAFYNGGNNEIDNLLPSCRQCNFYKSTFSLEVYREYVKGLLNRILDRSFVVRIAIKYGMLSINEWDGKFYFEKQDKVK